MASFNFDRFEQNYETRELVQQLATVLTEARRPGDANQRLISAEEGTPLHTLLAKLRVGQENTPVQFDFELGDVLTIEAASELCTAGGAQIPEMFTTIANRVLFNAALDRQHPRWVQVSRPEAADRNSELQALHFLNEGRSVVDWSLSLPELKRLAHNRLYTDAMMQYSLLHLVDSFCKDHKDLIRGMNSNQMANYLLSMERNRDKTSYRREELKALTRKVGQEYKAVLIMAYTLIDRIFPADQAHLAAHRAVTQRTAIMSFLPDELALPLSARCQRAQDRCTPLSNEEVRDMAEKMEEDQKIILQLPLEYGRIIGAKPAAHHIQLNSMVNGSMPPANPYGVPYVGYPNPYVGLYPAVLPAQDGAPRLMLPPVVAPGQPVAPQHLAALGLAGSYQLLPGVRELLQAPPAAVGRPAVGQQATPAQQPIAPNLASAAELAADGIPSGTYQGEYDPDFVEPLSADARTRLLGTQFLLSLAQLGDYQQARKLAAANAAKQQETPRADYPLTGATPREGSAQMPPGTPLRPPGDSNQSTPSLGPNGASALQARRNILAEADLETDTLLEVLSGAQYSDFCDLLTKGQVGNTPKAQQRMDSIRALANSVLTRSQVVAATPATPSGGQVSLSSINLEQPLTAETVTLMLIDALKEVKKLSRMGANMNLDDPSYKRGQVINGRYSSSEREEISRVRSDSRSRDKSQRDQSRGRDHSRDRDRSQRDQSRGRDHSKDRSQSYRDQSRGRDSSRDRNQSYSGQRRDSRNPSEDRNRTRSDFQSRSRDGKDSKSYRDQSRDRSYPSSSSQSYSRTQSRSPARSSGSSHYSSVSRPGRSPSGDRTSRSSSLNMREIYRSMRKGENCRLDYDPRKQKDCTKCTNPGHHEFECRKYSAYGTKKCSTCQKCYHLASECKEKDRFPPNPGEKQSQELEKN